MRQHNTCFKTVVTVQDALMYSIKMSANGWASEVSLWNTTHHTLYFPESLNEMKVPIGESKTASKAVMEAIDSGHVLLLRNVEAAQDAHMGLRPTNGTNDYTGQ